ncbi:MAG: hypothetical protein MJE63_03400 [Proteobacteria bacterium]|nr:hypothetical protein [Pseudomonadota bacterium]
MKKMLLFILFVAAAFATTSCDSQSGTMVFADKQIKKGQEDKVELKASFTNKEAVYARAYLKEEIGAYQPELNISNRMYKDDFTAELYIDGEFKDSWHALKNEYTADPSWKQFQFFVFNTSDRPDFPPAVFKKLSKGKHDVEIKVIRKRINGDTELASGEFEFVVE